MPVLSRVTCFPIAILSMNISAQNARKPSLMEKKTWLYRNPFFSFEHIRDKRQRSKSKISCTLYLLPFSFAGNLSYGERNREKYVGDPTSLREQHSLSTPMVRIY